MLQIRSPSEMSNSTVMFPLCSAGIQRSDSDMGGVEPPYCMLRRRIKHICDNPDTDVWESVEERDRKIAIVLTEYFLRHHELGTEINKVSLDMRLTLMLADGFCT